MIHTRLARYYLAAHVAVLAGCSDDSTVVCAAGEKAVYIPERGRVMCVLDPATAQAWQFPQRLVPGSADGAGL